MSSDLFASKSISWYAMRLKDHSDSDNHNNNNNNERGKEEGERKR